METQLRLQHPQLLKHGNIVTAPKYFDAKMLGAKTFWHQNVSHPKRRHRNATAPKRIAAKTFAPKLLDAKKSSPTNPIRQKESLPNGIITHSSEKITSF